MKRTITGAVLTVLLLIVCTYPAHAQGFFSIRSVTSKVLNEGILYPEPHEAAVFFDDFWQFDSNGANEAGWILTAVGTSPVDVWDYKYGVARAITGDTENNGVNIQWNAEVFKANRDSSNIDFETYVKISEDAQQDFVAGLWVTDTTIIDSALPSDGIGIYTLDGDSLLVGVIRAGSTSILDTLTTVVTDNTWIKLGFKYNWPYVKYFVNGVQEGTTAVADTTSIPKTVELAPSLAFETGDTAAESLYVDYMYIRQDR